MHVRIESMGAVRLADIVPTIKCICYYCKSTSEAEEPALHAQSVERLSPHMW